MTLEWPCLSFDLVRDGLGEQRDRYPLTTYAVAGTQADLSQPGSQNSLLVLKMSQLHKTQHDSDDEADSDSDEEDGDAVLEHRAVHHNGAINRVRCQSQAPNVVATWSETGCVNVFDVSKQLAVLDGPLPTGQQPPSHSAPPLQTFQGTQNA
jgi:ribosome assembly protein RRB1